MIRDLATTLKYSTPVVESYRAIQLVLCRKVEAYVFVATTGRSGSQTLSAVFEAADDAVSLHEPYPIMYSDHPPSVEKEGHFRRLFLSRKRINIRRAAAGYRYYVETNHQFIKSFCGQAIEEFGDRIRVIHLHRDPVSVATSLLAIGSIPGKTPTGRLYLLDPAAEDNTLRIPDLLYGDPRFSHDIFKCLWYCYETEARIEDARRRYPYVRWHFLRTEQLNDATALRNLFDRLSVSYSPHRLVSLAGMRLNPKTEQKTTPMALHDVQGKNALLTERLAARYGDVILDPSRFSAAD